MVFKPARRRPPVMASSAPSADTGSGLTATASSPSAMIFPEVCRVSVRAQIEVEAIAALTVKPRRASAPHHDLQQRAFAAEQMGAAGDVEIQPMRRIERHQRREAVAPVGDVVERLAVGDLVGVEHRQLRADGAGIGERQADREAGAHGQIVEGVNQQRVVLLGDDDAGSVTQRGAVRCKLALDAVDGQAWQPQAEDTPPVR